jgi:hypothetical protein
MTVRGEAIQVPVDKIASSLGKKIAKGSSQ